MRKFVFIIILWCLPSRLLVAQEFYPDTSLKNTIRLNITPLLITSNFSSATLGYERVVGRHQSLSLNIGHLGTPAVLTTGADSPVEWVSGKRNTGIVMSFDYRFYFKRNRYLAPDGLYWGPYAAYYYMDKAAEINLRENGVIQGSADLQVYLSMVHVGIQLGYQFVFWDRWTLDLVLFGPGTGFYSGQISLDTDVSIEEDREYLQGAFDALKTIYPGVGSLIENKSLSADGEFSFRSLGYRMVVQIGFRF